MTLEIRQVIELHNKVEAIEKSIFDFDYSPKANPDLDENLKNIYISLQKIKGLIYTDKIDFQGVR